MSGILTAEAPLRRSDYYRILELPPGAPASAVGKAYWRLARRYHARLPSDPFAAAMLEALNKAVEGLATPESDPAAVSLAHTATAPARLEHNGQTRRILAIVVVFVVAALALSPAFGGASRTRAIAGVAVTSAPVIFLGDSVTHGVGASSSDASFAQLLQDRLDDVGFASGPASYDSAISALGGQAVDMRFAQDIGARPRSLIVVEVGAHSVLEDANLTPRQYGIGYGMMLDCLQSTGATVVVSTVPWLGWSSTDPLYQRAAERSYMIRAEAAKHGVPVADLWSNMKDRPELLSSDRFHPNDAGHRLIADLYWMQIVPRLGATHAASSRRCDYSSFLAGRTRGLPADTTARGA